MWRSKVLTMFTVCRTLWGFCRIT